MHGKLGQILDKKYTKDQNIQLSLMKLLLLLLLSGFSRVRLCATPETAAHQAPLSLGFSRQEHWSGCHFLLQCMKVKSESEVAQSRVLLLGTPWTAAHQAPPSMGFSRQEYWSGLPLPSPTYEETGAKPGCWEQKQGTVHIPFTPITPEPPLWPKPWTYPYPHLI